MKTVLNTQKIWAIRWTVSAASIIFAIGITLSPMYGEVIYQNGFEADQNYSTTGGTGGVGRIGGQGSNGSNLQSWTTTNGEDTKIVTSMTSGGVIYDPPQGDQMLQAQYGIGSTSVLQKFAGVGDEIKESFTFSFKMAVVEETISNAGIYLSVGSSAATGGMDFGILRYGSGTEANPYVYGFAARQSNPGGSSYATRIGTDTFSLNEFHTFSLTLDWDTLTFSGTVYDSSNTLVTSFSNVAMWDRDGAFSTTGFNRVGVFIHQVGTRPYFLIDDLQIATIPEPSAVALVFLGAVGLFFYSRRLRTV